MTRRCTAGCEGLCWGDVDPPATPHLFHCFPFPKESAPWHACEVTADNSCKPPLRSVWGTGWLAALPAQESKSPNERLRMACIGVGGKGASDSDDAARFGDVVAICDIDEQRLEGRAKGPFEKSKRYTDFRKMFDELGSSIDAVTVSTPDHNHAPAALMAMRMGKHCFCQKPLDADRVRSPA